MVDSSSIAATPEVGEVPGLEQTWPGLGVAARKIGAPLSSAAIQRLGQYRDLLLEWNKKFNLTAIKEPDAIERVLMLDTIQLIPFVKPLVEAGLNRDSTPRLVDIGSGAGFPGLPLAICLPELNVTALEATGKKVSFLNTVIAELDLYNVRAIHCRSEELAREAAHRGQYDVGVARAVASLPALTELTAPFLRIGGQAFFPKGLDVSWELAAVRIAARDIGVELRDDVVLPGGETRLFIFEKTRTTPGIYPRRAGIPAKEPIGAPATEHSPVTSNRPLKSRAGDPAGG